jgi:hypothetical protein
MRSSADRQAADIAEVHVENLVATAEATDDIEDLSAGVLEILRNSPLAEVEAVIRAFLDGEEFLQTRGWSHGASFKRHGTRQGSQ